MYNKSMELRIKAQNLKQSAGSARGSRPLFEVDLDWKGPGIFVLMGESGVGKSTLLKSLGGVWKPQSGKLEISNTPLWLEGRFNQNTELLSKMGFCFQNNALFNSMSCLENLCFPHRQRFPMTQENERQDLAMTWLDKVGLSQIASLFPDELSGGMQKRLSLARTLILKPDFLFFDDPTAGLDPITSRQIAKLLLGLLDEHPALSVIVTNDEDRAKEWSQQIFDLTNGQLTAHKEIEPPL